MKKNLLLLSMLAMILMVGCSKAEVENDANSNPTMEELLTRGIPEECFKIIETPPFGPPYTDQHTVPFTLDLRYFYGGISPSDLTFYSDYGVEIEPELLLPDISHVYQVRFRFRGAPTTYNVYFEFVDAFGQTFRSAVIPVIVEGPPMLYGETPWGGYKANRAYYFGVLGQSFTYSNGWRLYGTVEGVGTRGSVEWDYNGFYVTFLEPGNYWLRTAVRNYSLNNRTVYTTYTFVQVQ